MSWYQIEHERHKGIASRLCGPFIVLGQHDPIPDNFDEYPEDRKTNVFELQWGRVVYQRGEDGSAQLCGYWYDTSD